MIRNLAVMLTAFVIAGAVVSCSANKSEATKNRPAGTSAPELDAQVAMPSMADDRPRDYPGIHNAVAYHKNFVSGSAPEGDAGFDTLRAMGVKTIISVDGAVPHVNQATSRGMRYIHLPIGYNGFDEERKLQLVRATRDAMLAGPVYIHCHHGQHRSAGAAAAIAASLGWETPEQGVARMRISGTAPNYTGLYACASAATVIAMATIDRVPADFPSTWKPNGYVKGMVEIDEVFERLKVIEKAGWITPREHPDLVPVAEAGRLADLYRVLHDSEYVQRKPAGLAELMQKSHAEAQALEDLLGVEKVDAGKATGQFKLVGASCKDCHTKYRD